MAVIVGESPRKLTVKVGYLILLCSSPILIAFAILGNVRLGGVAYVNPPQRPGATLWSIAAGPLVNVALLPILIAAVAMSRSLGWAQAMPDVYQLLRAVLWIDGSLLVFNMLPIYPLDGGQILRSLLWFVLGRARSLMVATVLGFVGVVGFFILALWVRSVWIGAISVFMLMN